MILSTIDGTIVATALPTIAADLGNEELRSWVITTYLLALIATMPLYGKLGDLYGRKRVYITAISIFTVGSMLCGAAGSMASVRVASARSRWRSSPTSCRPDSSADGSATRARSSPARASSGRSPAASSSTTCRGTGRST
jgi:MFS family permease